MQGTLEQREPRPLAIIQARGVADPRVGRGGGFEGGLDGGLYFQVKPKVG